MGLNSVLASLVVILLVACSSAPTATQTLVPTLMMTITPALTATIVPIFTPRARETFTSSVAATPLPTMTPSPTTAPSSTPLPKDTRGFAILETEHATILSQPGVSDEKTLDAGKALEIVYQVVGEDLGFPDRRPRLYVYRSEDDLFQDLIATWGFPADWVKTYRAIPRMNRDYEAWIAPSASAQFICALYAERIIEQIAGLGSQSTYKWFDSGLADYEMLRAVAVLSPFVAGALKEQWQKKTVDAYKAGMLIHFRDMTTEGQWTALGIGTASGLNYTQSAIAMDFLIGRHGILQARKVLNLVGQGRPFPEAFQAVYAVSMDDFEKEFVTYLANLKAEHNSFVTPYFARLDVLRQCANPRRTAVEYSDVEHAILRFAQDRLPRLASRGKVAWHS